MDFIIRFKGYCGRGDGRELEMMDYKGIDILEYYFYDYWYVYKFF